MLNALQTFTSTFLKWHEFSRNNINIHDEHKSTKPSVISDELLQRIGEAICANQGLLMREFPFKKSEVSKATLYKAVTVTLGFNNKQ